MSQLITLGGKSDDRWDDCIVLQNKQKQKEPPFKAALFS